MSAEAELSGNANGNGSGGHPELSSCSEQTGDPEAEMASCSEQTGHPELPSCSEPTGHPKLATSEPTGHPELPSCSEQTGHPKLATREPTGHPELASCSEQTGHPEAASSQMSEDPDTWPAVKAGEEGRKRGATAELPYEQLVLQLRRTITGLLQRESLLDGAARTELKFVQRQTRYSGDSVVSGRVIDVIVHGGIAHVFLRVWRAASAVDFLAPAHRIAYKTLQAALSIVWNCTDKSVELCSSVARCGVVQLLLSELEAGRPTAAAAASHKDRLYLAKAYLGILHNVARLCAPSRAGFRAARAVAVLRAWVPGAPPPVEARVYLTLAYVVTEGDSGALAAAPDRIAFLIDILRDALACEAHFSATHAFCAAEITCGLNHLAINDANKASLGEAGVITLYTDMLRVQHAAECLLAAAGLWILAFHRDNAARIRREDGCVQVLQSLAANGNEESVRRAARGALWVVNASIPRLHMTAAKTACGERSSHVMLSYQWLSQRTVMRVKHHLLSAGYKVWMDVDNMSGSTLEAMALAVEHAAVILIAMSQQYKESVSCRTEAEYCYRLKKAVIPLLLQPGYEPDGWLGLLVGVRLHFDFSSDDRFGASMPRLLKELAGRGRADTSRQASVCAADDMHNSLDGFSSLTLDSTSSRHSYGCSPTVASWSQERVQHWLGSQGLSAVASRFAAFTGRTLLQYRSMMTSAPEFFYRSLEQQLQLELVSILEFSHALHDL